MPRQVVKAIGRSRKQVDAMALTVVKDYQPEMLSSLQPFNVQDFFELELPNFRGITTDYKSLSGSIHAYTDINEMRCVVSLELMESQHVTHQRRFLRSTLSHETGHCDIHVPEFRYRKAIAKFVHDKDHQTLRMYREEVVLPYENPEWQAWRYAGALMMPEPSVYLALKEGCSKAEMCEIFDLNMPFVETRLRALGLADKFRAY
jgi:hypothetical protein